MFQHHIYVNHKGKKNGRLRIRKPEYISFHPEVCWQYRTVWQEMFLKSKQVIRFITAMNNDDKYSLINDFLGDTGKTEKTN